MKDLFCAKCQNITPHKGEVDFNGEFVFACQNIVDEVACNRFVKFPADTDPALFKELVKKHEEVNVGQVSLEGQEAKLSLFLAESLDGAQEPQA